MPVTVATKQIIIRLPSVLAQRFGQTAIFEARFKHSHSYVCGSNEYSCVYCWKLNTFEVNTIRNLVKLMDLNNIFTLFLAISMNVSWVSRWIWGGPIFFMIISFFNITYLIVDSVLTHTQLHDHNWLSKHIW